ncbi:MinD/ParA family ATP-binding protein [Microbacterium sp. NPDC055683]
MSSTSTQAATWPRVEATVNADGTAEVSIGGTVHPIEAEALPEARTQIVALVAAKAGQLGRPLRALMSDPDGEWPLIIHPDGTTAVDEEPPARTRSREADAPTSTALAPQPPVEEPAPEAASSAPPVHRAEGWVRSAEEQAAEEAETPAAGESPAAFSSRRERRQSFLLQEQVEKPATQGWRGAVTRAGIRMSPSAAERAERADVRAVSQHWPGPRTIAIVNAKGGASKTPTTILLSATFARHGGAGVLAWDNNQTRGTLGWRTEQGPHDATLLELLPEAGRLLSTDAQSADLTRFVHHQTADRFDVLRSKPAVLASEQRITAEDVDNVHAVAAKYYRLIIIDSGNDETDPLWLRMIDHTDQLVLATTTRADHAEAGALLLESLADRDERSARLAANAVAIVNQADPKATAADVRRVADGYAAFVREAVTIPHDPAIVDGLVSYDALRPTTRRAWLAAGAAVARGL